VNELIICTGLYDHYGLLVCHTIHVTRTDIMKRYHFGTQIVQLLESVKTYW